MRKKIEWQREILPQMWRTNMIKCPKCGEELKDESIFCTCCGERVGKKPKPKVITKTKTVQKKESYIDGITEAFKFISHLTGGIDTVENHYPLVTAAEEGNFDVVTALLDAGANIDQTDDEENTALIKAVTNEHNKIVKKLIDAGADVNITNNYEETALSLARDNENRYLIGLLRGAGAKEDQEEEEKDDDDDNKPITNLFTTRSNEKRTSGGFSNLLKRLRENNGNFLKGLRENND